MFLNKTYKMAYERFISGWYFSEAYNTNRILCTLHRGTIIFTLWQPLLLLEQQLYLSFTNRKLSKSGVCEGKGDRNRASVDKD